MTDYPETPPPEWDLGAWEQALTIHVGTSYACRQCGNLVMVTKGGVGVMEMVCCGKPMEKLASPGAAGGEG
jgi:hypothetical protein